LSSLSHRADAGPALGRVWYVPVPHDDFAEFYQASYVRVVALVAAVVGDRQQAGDIAQEAFARALPPGIGVRADPGRGLGPLNGSPGGPWPG